MSLQPALTDDVAGELHALYDAARYQQLVDRFESLVTGQAVNDAAHAGMLQIAGQAYLRVGKFQVSANTFLSAAAIFATERLPAASVCMRNAFAALQRSAQHATADWVALRSLSLPRECGGDVDLLRHAVTRALAQRRVAEAASILAAASLYLATRTVALETLLDMARDPAKYGASDTQVLQTTTPVDSRHPKLSIIVCSRDDARYARFTSECARAMSSSHFEIIRIKDARSMCEGYNRGTDAASGELLLYCHDDIEFITDAVHHALIDALADFDIACCVGASVVEGPTWVCKDATLSQGWMAASDVTSGQYSLGVIGVPTPQSLLATGDGCFIACRRATALAVGWDEVTFDCFHMYDIDFCLRAKLSGYRIGVARAVVINHYSQGTFDASWHDQARRFVQKHALSSNAVPQPHWISMRTGSREETARVSRNLMRVIPLDFPQQLARLQSEQFAAACRETPALAAFHSLTAGLLQ